MNPFIQEDSTGNMYNEDDKQLIETKIEADEFNYPLSDVTNFDQYSDLKPPKKCNRIQKKSAIKFEQNRKWQNDIQKV